MFKQFIKQYNRIFGKSIDAENTTESEFINELESMEPITSITESIKQNQEAIDTNADAMVSVLDAVEQLQKTSIDLVETVSNLQSENAKLKTDLAAANLKINSIASKLNEKVLDTTKPIQATAEIVEDKKEDKKEDNIKADEAVNNFMAGFKKKRII